MIKLLNLSNFCLNRFFRSEVIETLCSNDGLFVLLLGKEAEKMASLFKASVIALPHPNARIINGKWGKYLLSTDECGARRKIKVIYDEIENHL